MAGTDQGEAFTDTAFAAPSLVLMHLVGITTGIGGNAVPTTANAGAYSLEVLDLLDLTGPRTNTNRPTLTKAAGTDQGDASTDVDSVFPDWFEAMHILPRATIDFGSILTQQQSNYEIYSAYRTADQTLGSITNNGLPGISLPDESPAEVAEAQASMLDSTTTDNTTDTIALGTLVKRLVVAETDGLPTFDTSVDFIFGSDTPQLFVSGSRIILIPMEYESPLRETLSFLTNVVTALDGKEQRIALRKQPRQLFEITYKLDANGRQRMQNLLMDWTDNVFGFPLYHEQVATSAAVSVGATTYPITGGDDVDFRVGGLAVAFTDENTFDVISIVSKTDTQIVGSDISVNGYAAGTLIIPVRTARMVGAVAGRRYLNNVEEFRVKFEVSDNDSGALTGDVSAYSTYNSRTLFDGCNVVNDTMGTAYTRKIYRIDNQTGLVNTSSSWDQNKRKSQKGFSLTNRSEIIDFRRLVIALNGKQKSFYIPTFIEDLVVTADLQIATAVMDIQNIEYNRLAKDRIPKTIFKIDFTDGTSLIRIVQSSVTVNSTTERLTVDTNWPANRTVAEISRIQFYELVRFDSDDVNIDMDTVGEATCTMPVMQVFDDN